MNCMMAPKSMIGMRPATRTGPGRQPGTELLGCLRESPWGIRIATVRRGSKMSKDRVVTHAQSMRGIDITEQKKRSSENFQPKALGAGMSDAIERNWWRDVSKFDSEIYSMAWPTLVSTLILPISMSIDAAIVGRLGLECLGAVGLSGLFWTCFQFFFGFIGVLGTTEAARATGNGDYEKLSRSSATNIHLCLAAGIFSTVTVFLGADWALTNVLRPDKLILPHAISYLKAVSFGATVNMLSMYLSGVSRGVQNTRTLLDATLISFVVNAVLDIVFVFGCGWGVAGAGIATCISTLCSTLYVMSTLVKAKYIQLKHILVPIDIKAMFRLLCEGQGLALRSAARFGVIFYASLCAGRLGSVESAAFEVVRQIVVLSLNSYFALEVAAQAICAKYHSRGDIVSLNLVLSRILQITTTSTIICSALACLFTQNLVALYTTNVLVMEQIVSLNLLLFLPLVAEAISSVLDGFLLGTGDVKFISRSTVAVSTIGIVCIHLATNTGIVNSVILWCFIKASNVSRLLFSVPRIFMADKSPLRSITT